MSLENLNRFAELVNSDAELQRRLREALDPKDLADRAVRLASGHGLEFSTEEFEVLAQQVRSRGGELSDKELGAVVGGMAVEYPFMLALIIVACIGTVR